MEAVDLLVANGYKVSLKEITPSNISGEYRTVVYLIKNNIEVRVIY
jgi:hypothetical protein